MKRLFLTLTGCLLLCSSCSAQVVMKNGVNNRGVFGPSRPLWSGVITAGRAVDWSTAGVVGGIPSAAWTQCGATIAPYTGAPTTINNAITACGPNQFVHLGTGTFNLNGAIAFGGKNNIAVRGDGADKTFVVFSASSGSILGPNTDVDIDGSFNWSGGPQNTTTWTAGYTQNTTQITLGSTASLSVGQYLILDQDNDVTDPGTIVVADTSTNVGSCQNQIFATDNSAAASSPGRNFGTAGTVSGSSTSCGGGLYPDRNQVQIVRVTAINGNTVTISPGLYMPNWRASQNPGAWWATTVIQNSGIENLTLDHTNSTNLVSGVLFGNAVNCWMKGVKSIKPNRNHVWWEYTAHIEVRDSYFFATLNAAALSYGVETWPSSDGKIENNIFQQVTSPHLEGGTSGTVYAYNFSVNDLYTLADWLIPSVFRHDAATAMNLTEGNVGSSSAGDVIHGTHQFETDFRNRWSGREPVCNGVPCTQQTVPENYMSHNRYVNIIGNVLGTSGYHTIYQTNYPGNCLGSPTANFNVSIYGFGWSADSGTASMCDANVAPDAFTITSSMRWGNYDTVNAAVRFVSAEVPSGLSLYANAIPASQTLPASFYLSIVKHPNCGTGLAWWKTPSGCPPFPPIGPDVTGGDIAGVGGFAYKIPAMRCYLNTMQGPANGSGAVLTFNASACYSSDPSN